MAESVASPIVVGLTATQRETIEKFYRGFSGEFDLLDEAVTPEWFDIPAVPGEAPGRETVKSHNEEMNRAFGDPSIVIHEMIGANGHAAVRAEIRGTFVGQWFGVSGKGQKFVIPVNDFFHFDGDRIAANWHTVEWLGWLAQCGTDGFPAFLDAERAKRHG